MDECNIFDALTRHEYQNVLDNMREIILATDLVAHLRKVERIQRMVNIGFNKNSSEHHYLFMCLLMTASDLSDQSKHFKYSKIIAVITHLCNNTRFFREAYIRNSFLRVIV